MSELKIVPDGWPVDIEECHPGFFVYEGQLCFKSEYGECEVFNSSGEYFCRRGIKVQPVTYEWSQNHE